MKNLIIIRHAGDVERLKLCEASIKRSRIDYCIVQEQYKHGNRSEELVGKHLKIYASFLQKNQLKKLENKQTGWVCGDYIFYAAIEYFPGYDYYWVIDDDLCLNLDVDQFIDKSNSNNSDLLATSFAKSEDHGFWAKKMLPYYPESTYAMLFGIVRLSARATVFLKEERKKYAALDDVDYPNDECFVASSLINNGFSGFNLRKLFDEFNPFFSLGNPVLYEEIGLHRFDNKILHPICSPKRALAKISDEKFDPDKKIDLLFRWYVNFGSFFVESNFEKNVKKIFVDKSKNNFYVNIPIIYEKFNHLLLSRRWFYTSRLLVLDFSVEKFQFALDVHWNGDVNFIARSQEAKNFLKDHLLGDKSIERNGIFVNSYAIFQKYFENIEGNSKILIEVSFLVDYLVEMYQREKTRAKSITSLNAGEADAMGIRTAEGDAHRSYLMPVAEKPRELTKLTPLT